MSISARRVGLGLVALLCAARGLRAGDFTPIAGGLPVGSFILTERGGRSIGPGDLRGKIWIAHFFYPTCQGPCTKTVPAMRRLQAKFLGKPDVVLVSIALTGNDLELLRRYAKDQDADESQWLFLTTPGNAAETLAIVEKCFFQTARRKPDGKPGDEIDHAASLIVVDRDGVMRGYIDGRDHDGLARFVEEVRAVAGERYRQPAVNAILNGFCAVLLLGGWLAIRRRREALHKACMLAALVASMAFLASYLWFHFMVLDGQPTRFRGAGWARGAYFALLLSHTILAAVVAPLALYVSYQGLRDRRPRHARVARWTLPIWLYVSITGVVVYWVLYQAYPPY